MIEDNNPKVMKEYSKYKDALENGVIKNGMKEKPDAISYIEEQYPETAKEFQRLQFEQWLLFCKKQMDYGPSNISMGTPLKTDDEKRLSLVGLQTDPTLDRPEKNKPIQSLEERKIQLEAVKYVDGVIIYETENDLYELLYKLMPDVRILGTDYEHKHFTGIDLHIPIYFHNRNHNYSTTNIRKKLLENK